MVIAELERRVEEHGTSRQQLRYLHVVAQAAHRRERYVLSEETEQLVRELHRRTPADDIDDAHFSLGFCLLWRGELDEALEWFQLGREAARKRGNALIETRCLVYASVARRKQGDVASVRQLLEELVGVEELHGYDGLVAANHAWLALRTGDPEEAERFAERAFADWGSARGSSGPTVFQWSARFPMLALELERGRLEAALEHARLMLDDSQQLLPERLGEVLARGLERADPGALQEAVGLARAGGYV